MTAEAQQQADLTGKDTLQSFSRAYRFNQWMFDRISPWARGRILEAGSGIGNISKLFIAKGYPIVLTDIVTDYLTRLRRTFGNDPNVESILLLDLAETGMEENFPGLIGRFDTVIALNVIEHINNDSVAISNCSKLLKRGGRLIMLVPAFPSLYNSFDRDLQHFRRYTKTTAGQLLANNGFSIIHQSYFNFIGMIGWFVSGTLFRNKEIPRGQLRIFEKLVPLFRIFDAVIFRSAGVSVITVGEKN